MDDCIVSPDVTKHCVLLFSTWQYNEIRASRKIMYNNYYGSTLNVLLLSLSGSILRMSKIKHVVWFKHVALYVIILKRS